MGGSERKLCQRMFVRVKGLTLSPLLVGSGEDDRSDRDVIVDGSGRPFIPGSALAGALRAYLSESAGNRAEAQYLFGGDRDAWSSDGFSLEDDRQSRLIIYDTPIHGAIRLRPGVRLDEMKAAEPAALYSVQMVETGASFTMLWELLEREQDAPPYSSKNGQAEGRHLLQRLLGGLFQGGIRLGAKGNRGFGRLAAEKIWTKSFDMKDSEAYCRWLAWDGRDENAFSADDLYNGEQSKAAAWTKERRLCVPLKVRSTIMIRQYTPEGRADYAHLRCAKRPVIPGSSWTGALRGRIEQICCELLACDAKKAKTVLAHVFGAWGDNASQQSSVVRVEESCLEGGHECVVTRNAIDRFTGGTVNGALYTAQPWIGGRTKLQISWVERETEALLSSAAIAGLLLWAALDLQNGLLPVGGETAVGRGCLEKDGDMTLDGNPITPPIQEQYCKAALDWLMGIKGGDAS